MDSLLSSNDELFKLNSYAPLLKKLKKSMIENKELEQNGFTLKAVHGYMKVEQQLYKALNDHKKRFDVTALDPILVDVQSILKEIDPDGLLRIEVDKKHKSKLKSKIMAAVTSSPSTTPRVIFLNDDNVDVISLSKDPKNPITPLPVKNIQKMLGVNLKDPRIAKGLTKITENPMFKLGERCESPAVSSAKKKKPMRTMSQDSPTLQKRAMRHAENLQLKNRDRRQSIMEEINIDTPQMERNGHLTQCDPRHSHKVAPIPNTERSEDILDTTGYKNREVEETYAIVLQCIFFPTLHLMSTRAMLNVVSTSFNYSKDRHAELEERAISDVGYMNFVAICLKQLDNVENHSFYSKDAYKTEEEYDKFVTLEKERINKVITQLQEHTVNMHKNPLPEVELKEFDYHRLYTLLLKLLVRNTLNKRGQKATLSQADLKAYFKKSNEGYQDIVLLSPFAVWLLEEFGDRCGIRKLFRSIALYQVAAHLYEASEDFLHLLISLSKQIEVRIEGGEPVTKEEHRLLDLSTDKLRNAIRLQLEDYSHIPKCADSQHVLKHIVELLDLTNSFDKFSEFKNHDTKEMLLDCVKSSIEKRYGSMIEDENKDKRNGLNILNDLCDELTLEIGATSMYEPAFKKHFDIMEVVTNRLFSLLEDEVKYWFRSFTENSKGVGAREVINIYTKLLKLNNRFSKRIPVEDLIVPFLKTWIRELSVTYSEWVKNAVEKDQWTPVDKEELLISHSAIDLFCMFSDPISFLADIIPIVPGARDLMTRDYAKVMCETINLYAKKIGHSTAGDFPANLKTDIMKQAKRHGLAMSIFIGEGKLNFTDEQLAIVAPPSFKKQMSIPFILGSRLRKWAMKWKKPLTPRVANKKLLPPPAIKSEPESNDSDKPAVNDENSVSVKSCIQMNNLEFCRTKLDEVLQDMALLETDQEVFDSSFSYLKKKLDNLMQLNTYWMNIYIKKEINNYVKDTKNSSSEALINFLDRQLEILVDNLSPPLFRRSIARLWEIVIQDIHISLVGDKDGEVVKSKVRSKTQEHVKTLISELKEFFNAGGKGLSDQQLEAPIKTTGLDKVLGTARSDEKSVKDVKSKKGVVSPKQKIKA